jgi:Zn-finger nucleic acid-binding protein
VSNPIMATGRIPQPKLCPVCQQPLVEVGRWGLGLDVCQRCQGVWLDQGELEQIVGFVRASIAPEPSYPYPRDDHHHDDDHHGEHHDRDRGPRHEDDDRHGNGHFEEDEHGRRRRRRFEVGNLLDIFG